MSDFSSILPNDQKVLERDDKWKSLFEKYENCADCEEDGYDIRDLIACGEVEDEENEFLCMNEPEAAESGDETENSNENNQDLVVYNGTPKTLQDLEKIYEPEYIQGLKKAFNKRCAELDTMNLHYWKRSSKTQEGFNESNIKTPTFEASSRSFFRSSEQVCKSGQKSQELSPKPFKMPHPVNFNCDNFQFGNFAQSMDQTNTFETSQRLPFPINDLMNGSQKINIRIREMHYDLFVDGRDITEFFIPNCNSTYKNAVPALGNLTIDSTIPIAETLQKMEVHRPAIKDKTDQIRTEPTQKVIEKPELDLSNVELLNNSGIDNSEGISHSSRDGYNLKGSKTSKGNEHKKKHRKRNHKLKLKDVKPEKKVKEIAPIELIVPISEKLELSYSDVVKLSPKNDLKPMKSSKPPVNDSKKQSDPQQNKKNNQEKNCGEVLKSYRRIIDPDTSTEDLFEKQEVAKTCEKVEKLIQQQEEKKGTLEKPNCVKDKQSNKINIPIKQKDVQKDEKLKDLKQLESQKSKDVVPEISLKNHEKNKAKENKKPKDKPEVSNKSEVSGKLPKSSKSKENKKLAAVIKSEMPSKSQVKVDKHEKQQKVKQKSKDIAKVIENEKEQQQEKLSKIKDLGSDKKENESDLQYDENGIPFRNIGGFIVRYESSDSDSSMDDTEFFRRIHEEIRQKKCFNNKN